MNLNDAVINEENWINNANLLEKFLDVEVFFHLVNPPAALLDGVHVVSDKQEMRMQFVTIADEPLALFYTTKHNGSLKDRIGGVPLHAAIEMVLRNPDVNGLLLQSDKSAWVVVKKDALKLIPGIA